MSFQAVTWAIGQRAGSPSAKATLWSIANYANENWCAWPSQRLICEESEQSPDSVQKRLPELEARGLIWRIPLRYCGRRTVDFVVLMPSRFFKVSLSEVEPLLPRGCSIEPNFAAQYDRDVSLGPCSAAAASSGSVDAALPQTLPQVAAHAAALERQHEPVIEPRNQVDDDGDARARSVAQAQQVRVQASDLNDEIMQIAGIDPRFVPPGWCGSQYRIEVWLMESWPPNLIVVGVRKSMARKRDGPPDSIKYFEKAIATEIAMQSAPLPKVSVIPAQEIVHVERAHNNPIAAAEARMLGRIDERIAELEASATCNGARGVDVEILP